MSPEDKKINEVLDRLDKKEILKICKDCKYSSPEINILIIRFGSLVCNHPKAMRDPDEKTLIYGKKPGYHYCSYMRTKGYSECSTEGNLFEPK